MLGVKGLEDYTYEEVKRMIDVYVHECIEDNEIDVTFIDSAIYGSRVYGDPLTGSDLDYVFEYSGDFSEDALYNILHEKDFDINGIYVDINPIRADKSGNIRDYIKKAEVYKKMNEGFCNVGYEGPIEIELEANTDDSPTELKWLCCVSQEYPKMIEFECTCQDNGCKVYFDIAKSNLQACYAEEGNWDSIVAKHLKWASKLKLNESAFNLQKNSKVSNVEFDDDEVSADQIKEAELYYKLNNLVEKLLKDDNNFSEEDVEHFKEYSSEYPVDCFKYKVKNKEDLDTLIGECSHYFGVKCDLNWIDVSGITDMSNLFDITSFDGDISKWDVSNVKNMRGMFKYSSFNGDISGWDVSNVTDMSCMFMRSKFNRDISRWDVSSVTDMSEMFLLSEFNQDISDWDVSNVVHTVSMFSNCPISPGREPKIWSDLNESAFNLRRDSKTSDIEFDNDEVSADQIERTELKYRLLKLVTKMLDVTITPEEVTYFKENCSKFDNDPFYVASSKEELIDLIRLSLWYLGDECDLNWINVSQITDMQRLFSNCFKFNGDISNWDVSNVENMEGMFHLNRKFNCDISSWDVSNVKSVNSMFYGCTDFCLDLSEWQINPEADIFDMFMNANKMQHNPKLKPKYQRNASLTEAVSNFNLRRDVKVNDDEFDDDEVSADQIERTKLKYSLQKIVDKIKEDSTTEDDIEFFNSHCSEFDADPFYIVHSNEELKNLIIDCTYALDYNCDLNWIDVREVTDMTAIFYESNFDGDISKWDVSGVTNMESMFEQSEFNGDISGWDVSSVTNMSKMFKLSIFDSDISNWNVSNVTDMHEMFRNNYDFNQNISNWDVSNVENMEQMFSMAVNFTKDLSSWNIKTGCMTEDIFYQTEMPEKFKPKRMQVLTESAFNLRRDARTSNIDFDDDDTSAEQIERTKLKYRLQKIVDKIKEVSVSADDIEFFIEHCSEFDNDPFYIVHSNEELHDLISIFVENIGESCDLNWIDVSCVTNMHKLFYNSPFNGDISKWDVSRVTDMTSMFENAEFNGDISKWDVSRVKDMTQMFYFSAFNQDISNWNVSNVTNMEAMFSWADFDQDISRWDASNVKSMKEMFYNTSFSHNISKWKINPDCLIEDMFQHTDIPKKFKPKALQKINC